MMAAVAILLCFAAVFARGSSYEWMNEDSDLPEQVPVPQLVPPPTSPTRVQYSYVSELPSQRSVDKNLNACPTEVCGVQPFDEKTGQTIGSFTQICKCSGDLQCQEYALNSFLRSYKTYVCAPRYSVLGNTKSSTSHDRRDL